LPPPLALSMIVARNAGHWYLPSHC